MWRILVVDDNPNNCMLLVSTLEGLADCDVAENGEDALVAYEQSLENKNPYHAILLDIAMPGIDGVEVLRRIRAREQQNNILPDQAIPIFMVTAHKAPFMDSFNVGCDDYILKPIEPDKVIAKITDRLEGPK